MTPLWIVLACCVLGSAGVWLTVTGWMQPRPALGSARVRLQRREVAEGDRDARAAGPVGRLGGAVLGLAADHSVSRLPMMPSQADLRLVGRPPEIHAAYLVLAAFGGLAGPLLLAVLARSAGVISLGGAAPFVVSLLAASAAPAAVHAQTIERARAARVDIRHQFSAYLDVVTMLLAGNTGHEGALEQAAHAGDGRLFAELRRRMREVSATGRSLVAAIDVVGRDLGIAELEQVAATVSLSAAEGAPVARTLSAKCATLRSTLATEHEAEARLRTSRLTAPLVGVALIFMALVIYPALSS